MEEIKIDVEKGDEEEVQKIRAWAARVPEKWIDDLETIYLFDDFMMNLVSKDLVSRHPKGEGILGMVKDKTILLRKWRGDDFHSIEQTFYHEAAHMGYDKKTVEEKKKLSPELLSIWNQYFKHFLHYKDADYQNNESEIFARIYSYLMLLTGEKAVIDLSKVIGSAMMKRMQEMFK